MPLQSSGSISLQQIATEFGDSAPHSLNEFYAGGSAGVTSGGAPNVPSSGEISFDDFYSAANQITVTISSNATNQNASTLFGSNYSSSIPKVLVINSGVEVGATSLSNYALNIPSGMGGTLNIQNSGTISGAGGDGGGANSNGTDGGHAVFVASSGVTVTNSGTIRGGGGGGGGGANGTQGGSANPVGGVICFSGTPGTGGAGGDGQGYDQSQSNGQSGTAAGPGGSNSPAGPFICGGFNQSTGGGTGGNGGTYGNAGQNAGGSGGASGAAVATSSNSISATISGSGTYLGST